MSTRMDIISSALFLLLTIVLSAINFRTNRRLSKRLADAEQKARLAVSTPMSWVTEHLMPALDGLDDAMTAAGASLPADVLAPFMAGLKIVQSQFFRALEACDVMAIHVALGDPFDPELHHAVDVVVSEDQPPGAVAAVLRRGYRLKSGKLLRPATVLVTKRAEQVSASRNVVALLAVMALLLSGCFETGYIGGWLLGRSSSQSATPADASAATVDGGTAAPAASSP
jgi:hypothetical protein